MSKPSSASLSVLPVEPLVRVVAPDDLTPAEAALWRAVVDSKPAEWFGPDSVPLLVEYVRAKTMCDWLNGQIAVARDAGETKELKTFLMLRDMEAKRVANLATKLRLTQQSRYTPQAAATADRKAGNRKPWAA